jgi:hypothetical protein
LTQVILETSLAELTTIENNDWCISRLNENMREFRQYTLITNYLELNDRSHADFLVIDANNKIFNVENLVRNSPKLKIIFIEGHHLIHRINICWALYQTGRRVNLIDVRENKRKKGCAYFEIEDSSRSHDLQKHWDFFTIFVPLMYFYFFLKLRMKISFIFDKFDKINLFASTRQLWKGKIPWKF